MILIKISTSVLASDGRTQLSRQKRLNSPEASSEPMQVADLKSKEREHSALIYDSALKKTGPSPARCSSSTAFPLDSKLREILGGTPFSVLSLDLLFYCVNDLLIFAGALMDLRSDLSL